jgi:hypothetical protein
MGMKFFFHYFAEDTSSFEVPETDGGFTLEVLYLSSYGSESFILEWQASCCVGDSFWPVANGSLNHWGPSSPFEPHELKKWVEWNIQFWKSLSDEEAIEEFPHTPELHRWDTPFGRKFHVEQAMKLGRQAKCAIRHQVKMTMEMVMG